MDISSHLPTVKFVCRYIRQNHFGPYYNSSNIFRGNHGNGKHKYQKRTIKLDDDGDLIFITQTQKLRVSSKVLIRASSALAMLVQYCKDTSLDLSSDHPIAVYIILSILHLKSSAVPKRVSLELLVAIAKVCGRYKCYAGVERWPCVWMGNVE
jgi:hypothetical protein